MVTVECMSNPEAWLPYVARTLNNLTLSQKDRNEFAAAQAGYEEALAICRRLAEANPKAFLPNVAMTVVNMSLFYLNAVPDRKHHLLTLVRT